MFASPAQETKLVRTLRSLKEPDLQRLESAVTETLAGDQARLRPLVTELGLGGPMTVLGLATAVATEALLRQEALRKPQNKVSRILGSFPCNNGLKARKASTAARRLR